MSRPLWQIFLTLLLVGFVLHRGALAAVLYLDGTPLLAAGYAAQVLAGCAAALGMWLGRLWTQGALVAVGVAVVATTVLLATTHGGGALVLPAVSQLFVVALSCGALVWVVRREFGGGVGRRPRPRPDAPRETSPADSTSA